MKQLLIDLDSTLKILFVLDNTALDLHDIPFTQNALSDMAEMILGFKPSKVTFITHNVLAPCLYDNSCVPFGFKNKHNEVFVSLANKTDLELLLEMCRQCGVTDIDFVDKLGYYENLSSGGVCYVEKHSGIYRLFCFCDGIQDYVIATEETLEAKKAQFMEKNVLNSAIDCSELSSIDYSMHFVNSAMILDDKETLGDIAVFAYACVENGKYRYDDGVLQRDVNSILTYSQKSRAVPEQPETVKNTKLVKQKRVADREVNSKAPIKKKELNQEVGISEGRSARTSSILSGVLLFAFLLSIAFTGFVLFKRYTMKSELAEVKQELELNYALKDSLDETLEEYQACLNTEKNAAFVLYNDVSSLLEQDTYTIQSLVCSSNEKASMTVAAAGSESATALVDSCTQIGYHAEVTESSEEDSDASECLVVIARE